MSGRRAGASIAGALLGALACAATAALALFLPRVVTFAPAGMAALHRALDSLAAGGWFFFPAWGAAAGALFAARWAESGRERLASLALALALATLPVLVRPVLRAAGPEEHPRSPQAKARAILRWSYRSPEGVRRILEMSRDPDPRVREQAVLALGVNLIVTDIERATAFRPARFSTHPLRAALRARLLEALADSAEGVRAEAARALWKAPRTFGREGAAAETLAAMLDRAVRPEAIERIAWLALDAAAGAPDQRLKAAASRFAAATRDSELRRVAQRAAAPAAP
ncbi:MAG TPA: hypothetical protein VGK89_03690 [Candidatus Eisenbacteria bacterium]